MDSGPGEGGKGHRLWGVISGPGVTVNCGR